MVGVPAGTCRKDELYCWIRHEYVYKNHALVRVGHLMWTLISSKVTRLTLVLAMRALYRWLGRNCRLEAISRIESTAPQSQGMGALGGAKVPQCFDAQTFICETKLHTRTPPGAAQRLGFTRSIKKPL